MKIKYKMTRVMCDTLCPFGKVGKFGDIYVGGWACKECKDFVSDDEKKNVVVCNGHVEDLLK
jgi:hypothetical protein